MGLDELGCRLPAPGGIDGSGEKGEQMAVLLGTGGTDGQDALDKRVALGAVRAETALPPEHGRAERLFGGIVGWLDALFADERPQRRFMGQQFLTHPLGRITAPCPCCQQPVQSLLDRCHRRLEQRAVDHPFAEQVPEAKYQAAQFQEICAPDARTPAPIHQGLKVANQMAPAQLVALGRQCQVGPMAIRADNPAIRAAYQVAQRRAVPTGGYVKAGGQGGHHDPQPAAFAGFFPAGLIHIGKRRRLYVGLDVGIDWCECRADRGLERDDAPEAQGKLKQVGEQVDHLTMTDAVAPVQQAHERRCARAEGPRWHIGGAFRRDERATARLECRLDIARGERLAIVPIADPIIGLVITLVILRITWDSWHTVREAPVS